MKSDDDLLFNLTLNGSNGEKSPAQFTQHGIRDLVVQVLRLISTAPVEPTLDRQIELEDDPVRLNGFVVTPLEGCPDGARLSIGIGPVDLQFAVSLPVLMQALSDLKEQTAPDPTSSRRPN